MRQFGMLTSVRVSRLSLEDFRRYISTVRSGPTGKRYAFAARMFLEWYGLAVNPDGSVPLPVAPRDTLMTYSLYLLDKGYGASTVQAHLAGVHRYLKWLQTKITQELPQFHKPELPSQKRKVKGTLSPNVLSVFFKIADGLEEPVRTAVLLLPCSGLRSEEMVSLPLACLKRISVDLENGQKKDVLLLRVKGKGGHERIVPLLDEGTEAIVAYLKGWRRKQSSTRWLFPGKSSHLATRTLRKAVQKVRTHQGEEFTPHSMRRTHLTALHRQGITPTILAKLAGHGDVQVLIDHYLDLNENDLAKSVHSAGGRLLS